eukprot:6475738-Amphidinium_carterae.1
MASTRSWVSALRFAATTHTGGHNLQGTLVWQQGKDGKSQVTLPRCFGTTGTFLNDPFDVR